MRHIFTPDDQTNQNFFISCKQFVKYYHFNPILHRPCVHPSTFHKVLIHKFCCSKCREIIIFAHNLFLKTQTNQASYHLDFQSSIFFLSLGLGT